MLGIIEYSEKYYYDLVFCMEKLQDFIVEKDLLKINIRAKEYWINYTNDLLEKIENNNWIIYIAIDWNNVIWCICLIIDKVDDEWKLEVNIDKWWVILELYVDQNYRWQQIWQKLMDIWEKYLIINWCKYIYLDVFAWNNIAHNFYFKKWYKNRMITMIKKV